MRHRSEPDGDADEEPDPTGEWVDPLELPEPDDDLPPRPAGPEALAALAQIIAALVMVALLGVVIVGLAAVLSWLFH
jgi:hypothetical protein